MITQAATNPTNTPFHQWYDINIKPEKDEEVYLLADLGDGNKQVIEAVYSKPAFLYKDMHKITLEHIERWIEKVPAVIDITNVSQEKMDLMLDEAPLRIVKRAIEKLSTENLNKLMIWVPEQIKFEPTEVAKKSIWKAWIDKFYDPTK